MRVLRTSLIAFLVAFAAAPSRAGELAVAAAANFNFVLKPLDAAFERAHPGTTIRTEFASSGSLVAQIRNGAPYDVFLSADTDYPKKLIESGAAQQGSMVVFAYGTLVLWTTRQDLDLISVEASLRNPAVRKIAMANPKTAPYGKAASEALASLHLTEAVMPRIVVGENISQAAQFVSSGNADLGFVALSLVMAPEANSEGRWITVADNLYKPLAHGAVLTSRGAANPAGAAYLAFLGSPEAKEILRRYGYRTP